MTPTLPAPVVRPHPEWGVIAGPIPTSRETSAPAASEWAVLHPSRSGSVEVSVTMDDVDPDQVDRLFEDPKYHRKLSEMADEALRDFHSGLTEPLDPDRM